MPVVQCCIVVTYGCLTLGLDRGEHARHRLDHFGLQVFRGWFSALQVTHVLFPDHQLVNILPLVPQHLTALVGTALALTVAENTVDKYMLETTGIDVRVNER